MPDDNSENAPVESQEININDPVELEHWSKLLGVSKEELVSAVKIAGTSTKFVRRYLWR